MNTQFNQSLAGTKRQYVMGQGKLVGSTLHMQFAGEEGNRSYGLSVDISNVNLGNFMPSVKVLSLQGNGRPYFGLQADVEGGNSIKVQIPGKGGNRETYTTLTIDNAELAEWLTNLTPEPVKVSVSYDYDNTPDKDNNEDVDTTTIAGYVSQIKVLLAHIEAEL